MILFSDANGTIQTNFGTPVYQGSANSNTIYLIAPYAPAASVLVGFQLPDGTAVAPVAMTALNAVPGVQNAGGTSYAGWSYVLPATVTAKYGTVTAQFFFYAPTGESTNPTSIIATSATSFQIGRGAAAVLPDTPDADVYESILSNLAQLQTDLNGGYYGARAIFPWSNGATYGLNEITFYPSIGTYGAFVQSVVAGNTNNAPYVDGALNSAYWKEVVNFNNIAEDYFQQVQEAVAQAESAAREADNSAQAANGSAQAANGSAQAANGSAQAANESARAADGSAQAAAGSASAAAGSAKAADGSAQAAAQSATDAQQYAQQAQQYAQKHYQVVASVSALPRPGDSAFIYLVPTGSGTAGDSYSEYLWITESNDYEFIGTTADIDLSNYAQINGTYAGMTVGNATNAQTATNAQQLGGVAAANYAQTNGTYSGMTVGNATQAQNAATATDSEKLGGVLANQYAIITGTYSGMTVGNATNATNADTADSATSAQDSAKLGGVSASEYALQSQLPVANPTATGTQDLTALQVGGTVYNIPQNTSAITNYQVIEYADELPTASETSPNFIQTPDGTLYRKKAVESTGGLVGTWVFNNSIVFEGTIRNFNVNFSSNGSQYSHIESNQTYDPKFGSSVSIYFGSSLVYSGSNASGNWTNTAYKTIQITDISALTNVDEFTTWLTANATGGGASVSYEYVAMQDNSENVVIAQTVSAPSAGITYIQCTLSGTVSPAGNYYFVNCLGSITVSGTSAIIYITDSPALTVNGITSDNWRNVFVDGIAEYAVSNSTSTIDKDTSIGTVIANFKIISDDYVFIRYTWTDLSALDYKSSILQRVDGSNISTYAMTGVYATLSKQTAVSVLTSDATSENITLTTNSFNNQDGRFTINSITVRRYL